MKRVIAFLAVAGILGIAQAEGLKPYVRAGIGPMLTEDADVSSGPYPAGSEIEFDIGLTVSAAVGIECETSPMRAELEYDYVKYYSDEANFAGFSDRDKLIWHVFMANAYYAFKNASLITPFFTAGLGYADAEHGVDGVLAYQLGAGLELEMTETISLDLKYRYFSAEDPELADSRGNFKADFASHQLMFDMRYSF